jgi:hypothetical protein
VPDTFPVLDVSDWELIENEVLGQNPKVWLRAPDGGPDKQGDWLFKPVVTPPSTGVTQLARRRGERGLISRNVVPARWSRILGSDLLRAKEASYVGSYIDGSGIERRLKGRPGHSPRKIARVLAGCDAPNGTDHLGDV